MQPADHDVIQHNRYGVAVVIIVCVTINSTYSVRDVLHCFVDQNYFKTNVCLGGTLKNEMQAELEQFK